MMRQSEGDGEASSASEERAEKAEAGDEQEWPDEHFPALGAVGDVGDEKHEQDGGKIGDCGEEAGAAHGERGALADDGGEPEDEAVDSEAPAEELRAEEEDVGAKEGLAEHGDGGRRSICSAASSCSRAAAVSGVIQRDWAGLSRTRMIQMPAQRMDGMPSMMKVFCQPKSWMRKPVMTDIQSTVSGLPRISRALARERSARVNQWVSRRSIAGKMRLSETPRKKRSSRSRGNERMTPVSAAKAPQAMSSAKTMRVTPILFASAVPGSWKAKYPRKKMPLRRDICLPVMWSVAAIPAAGPKPKLARSRYARLYVTMTAGMM